MFENLRADLGRHFATSGSLSSAAVATEMPEGKLGSVGIAIPGCELRVVDAAGQAVQGGEVGEIVARGANIMQGYLNDPESPAAALRGRLAAYRRHGPCRRGRISEPAMP